jgi:CRP-like cAMP-binding protein
MMVDFEKLKQAFPFIQELSTEDILEFLGHTSVLTLNAGDVFLKQGSRKGFVYFVKTGLVRSYFTDDKGEEITNRLRCENEVLSSYEIDLLNEPSRFTFQALEPTELIVIDSVIMRQLLEGNPKLESGRRYFMVKTISECLTVIDDFILLSPEKRYLKFLTQYPQLANRVPMKYIANMLGITPVSLSRIRKRIATKKQ